VTLRSFGDTVILIPDGQPGVRLDNGDQVEARDYGLPVSLIKLASRSYYEILREKLKWGRALSTAVMLRELRIRNFAVIDEVVLELKPGLNIITGETGAGKTIILDALGLIAGQRGSTDVIRNREDEASVEALFDSLPELVSERLSSAGFDAEEEIVIKRIVSRSGKNRIYLNGSLAPRNVLAEIGPSLVQIYGQHEHQTLLQPESHLSLLDGFAELEAPPARCR
jgi:DNA repair protein RecN (Recombination protein N)